MSWIEQNVDPRINAYLFNIKINDLPNDLGSYQKNIAPDLVVNYEMIEEQLAETPEMMAFWNMLLAEQKIKVEVIERQIRAQRGKITEKLLEQSRQEKVEIRSTESKELINSDGTIQQWETKLLRERKAEERLKVVSESLKYKFDSLRSLSGFKKEEKKQA
jgi:hypothetical protein